MLKKRGRNQYPMSQPCESTSEKFFERFMDFYALVTASSENDGTISCTSEFVRMNEIAPTLKAVDAVLTGEVRAR